MKVNIVNYEHGIGMNGILTKYALSMEKALKDLGVDVSVSDQPEEADINHHINYLAYRKPGKIDTLMITHLAGDKNHTHEYKFNFLQEALKTAFGISFSPYMTDYLVAKGIDKDKLDSVLPAHDSIPRRPRVIAILTNIYKDGRKNEGMYLDLFKSIDKDKFLFKIMGYGWEEVLSQANINKEYYPQFEMEKYKEILNTADYHLYVGSEDCMAQAALDTTNAGIPNIVPKQDWNKDIHSEYIFETQEELNSIFKKLEENRVADWTWETYVKKHLSIWQKLYEDKFGKQ
jgi:hypothetical protein